MLFDKKETKNYKKISELEKFEISVLKLFLKKERVVFPIIQKTNFEFPTVLWLVYNIDELSSYFFHVHNF